MKLTVLILGILITLLGFISGILGLIKLVNPDTMPKAQVVKLLLFFIITAALGAFFITIALTL